MNTSWRSASLVATAAAVLALTTACGQDGAPAASSQNVGATAPAGGFGGSGSGTGTQTGVGAGNGYGADGQQGAAGASRTAGQLAVSDDAELGKVLTDSAGMTFYRFDQDTAEPPKSNCDGDCAKAWP
ncbi:hypothetical protein ABT317_46965, partial [Streptomyces carpinensis]